MVLLKSVSLTAQGLRDNSPQIIRQTFVHPVSVSVTLQPLCPGWRRRASCPHFKMTWRYQWSTGIVWPGRRLIDQPTMHISVKTWASRQMSNIFPTKFIGKLDLAQLLIAWHSDARSVACAYCSSWCVERDCRAWRNSSHHPQITQTRGHGDNSRPHTVIASNSSRLYLPARTTPSYNHSPMRTSQFGTLYPPQCSRKHLAFALSNHSSQNRTSIYWRKTGSGLHKHTHNADLSFIFSLNSSLQCITLSLVFNMLTLYIYSLA